MSSKLLRTMLPGNVKFKAIEYKKGQEGTYKYTVEEVKGTDGTVQYDGMKAVVTVEVKHDGTAKALITNVTDAADKEFNNKVTPPDTQTSTQRNTSLTNLNSILQELNFSMTIAN